MQTVREEIEDIKEKICDHYCKFLALANGEIKGAEQDINNAQLKEICKFCPFTRL